MYFFCKSGDALYSLLEVLFVDFSKVYSYYPGFPL